MRLLQQLVIQRKAITRPASQTEIRTAEMTLGLRFDRSYREYLELFGIISYNSEEFYGLGIMADSHLNIIQATPELRATNMWPMQLIPLCANGDGSYFAWDNQKRAVVFWNHANGKIAIYEEILEMFFIERMFKHQ